MFIAIEGIEGSGKSTLIAGLAQALASPNTDLEITKAKVVITREPGGTALGRSLRQLLLHRGDSAEPIAISPLAELFLFCADRAQHIDKVIRPALAQNAFVLCDRFIYSTFAYQGYGRGLDLQLLRQASSIATGGLLPDLVLLLDLEPQLGLSRARLRSTAAPTSAETANSWTTFEAEELAFHQRVRQGFLALAKEETTRFCVLAASEAPEKILAKALATIKERQR